MVSIILIFREILNEQQKISRQNENDVTGILPKTNEIRKNVI